MQVLYPICLNRTSVFNYRVLGVPHCRRCCPPPGRCHDASSSNPCPCFPSLPLRVGHWSPKMLHPLPWHDCGNGRRAVPRLHCTKTHALPPPAAAFCCTVCRCISQPVIALPCDLCAPHSHRRPGHRLLPHRQSSAAATAATPDPACILACPPCPPTARPPVRPTWARGGSLRGWTVRRVEPKDHGAMTSGGGWGGGPPGANVAPRTSYSVQVRKCCGSRPACVASRS